MANSLSNKHKKDGGKILWVSIRLPEGLSEDEPLVDFMIADLSTKKLPPDTLIIFCQVNMEIRLDFLNRVSIIKNTQAFPSTPLLNLSLFFFTIYNRVGQLFCI